MAFAFCLVIAKSMSATDDKRCAKADSSRVHGVVMTDKKVKGREASLSGSRMASSTFPVHMKVKGGALCVTSDFSQLLPIYTRGGTFYMAMRLNKGLNWLNGLPKGRYLINNQPISIP